ncbi:MAG: hypothetical protein IJU64_03670 [Bacilli bacterium]|nr:hypothetical protein [Bacilli bacterium]
MKNLLLLPVLVCTPTYYIGQNAGQPETKYRNDYGEEYAIQLTKDDAAKAVLQEARYHLRNDAFSINKTSLIFDLAHNPYYLVELSPIGFGIYNPAVGDITQLCPATNSPKCNGYTELFFVPTYGFVLRSKSGGYSNFHTGCLLNQKTVDSLTDKSASYYRSTIDEARETNFVPRTSIKMNADEELTTVPHSSQRVFSDYYVNVDHHIDYDWYFRLNSDCHPTNTGVICGYVAASLVLGYLEIFKSSGYFSSSESNSYISIHEGTRYPGSIYPWHGIPEISDSFPTAAWGNGIGTTMIWDVKDALSSFIGTKKTYSFYYYLNVFASPTDPIDDGFPAIYMGNMPDYSGQFSGNIDHAVVIYGYSSVTDKLLVHFGYEDYSQVLMSKLGLFNCAGVLAVYNQSAHVHKAYFKTTVSNQYYCGCGALLS